MSHYYQYALSSWPVADGAIEYDPTQDPVYSTTAAFTCSWSIAKLAFVGSTVLMVGYGAPSPQGPFHNMLAWFSPDDTEIGEQIYDNMITGCYSSYSFGVLGVVVQPDGGVLLGGIPGWCDELAVVRFLTDNKLTAGSPAPVIDPDFCYTPAPAANTTSTGICETGVCGYGDGVIMPEGGIAVQDNGEILLAGGDSWEDGPIPNIVRINPPIVVNSTGDGVDSNINDGIAWTGGTVTDNKGNADPEVTLRSAIMQANANGVPTTIEFNIPGTGPQTIHVTSALPNITDMVTIDGSTQPRPGGGSGAPLVIVSGGGLVLAGIPSFTIPGTDIVASPVVNFLEITNVGGSDIASGSAITVFNTPNALIENCLITANQWAGVYTNSTATEVTGSLIVGNGAGNGPDTVCGGIVTADGVAVYATKNSIYGNGDIGLDLDGDGITENEPGRSDPPNSPVPLWLMIINGVTTTKWNFSGAPNTLYYIEFFANSHVTDPLTYRGGETYLNVQAITTDGDGNAVFQESLNTNCQYISATATRLDYYGGNAVGTTSEFSYVLNGGGGHGVSIDLGIDSDNNNGLGLPDMSPAEESVEDVPADPGKYITTDIADENHNGIPDYADGYVIGNQAPVDRPEDDGSARFTPVVLDLSKFVNPGVVGVEFTYDGSDPRGLTEANGTYAPAAGTIRLWKRDDDNRWVDITRGTTDGDYIVPGQMYTGAELGVDPTTKRVTLWVEGIAPTDPDPTNAVAVQDRAIIASVATLYDTVLVTTQNPVETASISGSAFFDRNKNTVWDKGFLQGKSPTIIFVFDNTPASMVQFPGTANTVLDAEIAGVEAMGQWLISQGLGDAQTVGVVFAAGTQITLNQDNVFKYVVTPQGDSNGDGVSDWDTCFSGIQPFCSNDYSPDFNNEDAALDQAMRDFNYMGTPVGDRNIIVMDATRWS